MLIIHLSILRQVLLGTTVTTPTPGADSIDCHLPVVAGTEYLRCSSREIPVPREQVPRKRSQDGSDETEMPSLRKWSCQKRSCRNTVASRRYPVLRITGGVFDDSGVPVPEKLGTTRGVVEHEISPHRRHNVMTGVKRCWR
jgi:hypothetical protein